ncbi:uncharacterized protein B0I36DRAFT_343556 [Microdochium trichocladiopsis]|uniref:Uncharacterized protein n=1 Tax=Microdochium trichocladiopsis TaxID=1682393 RepID=A0A9P8YIM2_9PEZI|nr:uncharacterized protein B0I36DRAFT_343556 [Microdochium trichocladiopsis]KAH7039699.1 hypothetical protein B0I36DRAFT_343556 [Microdochium trichocladiopsis]
MRFDTATLALTALSLLTPPVTGGFIPRRRVNPIVEGQIHGRHNFADGSRGDAAARALLERATPEHERLARVPGAHKPGRRIDHDYTVDQKSRANPLIDSDPTYEISYLSKSDDDVVYDDEQPGGDLRRRNPFEASCFDVPTFALNGILGMYPPGEKCTHVRAGERTVAITCYHAADGADDDDGFGMMSAGGRRDKRSAEEMHEERKLQFLSLCDTSTRPELMVN